MTHIVYYAVMLSIIILTRFLINYFKYLKVVSLYKKYLLYLCDKMPKFIQYSEEVKSLLRDAGLKDFSIIHQEMLGFGQYSNMTLSGFDNLSLNREDVVINVGRKFEEAIGVYRKRWVESFNPIFWIECVLKLPQYIFGYFGVLPDKAYVKIFQILYWITTVTFGLRHFNVLDIFQK